MPSEIYNGNTDTLICFLRSEYTTAVYHNLFKKFPEGCRFRDMNEKIGIGSGRLGNIFNIMCKMGLAEREKIDGKTYTYKHIRLDEPQIMDVMERSATYGEAYYGIESMWDDKINSVIRR